MELIFNSLPDGIPVTLPLGCSLRGYHLRIKITLSASTVAIGQCYLFGFGFLAWFPAGGTCLPLCFAQLMVSTYRILLYSAACFSCDLTARALTLILPLLLSSTLPVFLQGVPQKVTNDSLFPLPHILTKSSLVSSVF